MMFSPSLFVGWLAIRHQWRLDGWMDGQRIYNNNTTVAEGGIVKGYEYTVEPLLYLFVNSNLKQFFF